MNHTSSTQENFDLINILESLKETFSRNNTKKIEEAKNKIEKSMLNIVSLC